MKLTHRNEIRSAFRFIIEQAMDEKMPYQTARFALYSHMFCYPRPMCGRDIEIEQQIIEMLLDEFYGEPDDDHSGSSNPSGC